VEKMKDKERFMMYVKITQRAEGMGIYNGERFSLLMDIENADKAFNLRLEDLLNADDLNFSHDVIGIVNNIDRKNPTDFNLFVPRYTEN
jgi:hypothetical protein